MERGFGLASRELMEISNDWRVIPRVYSVYPGKTKQLNSINQLPKSHRVLFCFTSAGARPKK